MSSPTVKDFKVSNRLDSRAKISFKNKNASQGVGLAGVNPWRGGNKV
jgi:hypothetical protein